MVARPEITEQLQAPLQQLLNIVAINKLLHIMQPNQLIIQPQLRLQVRQRPLPQSTLLRPILHLRQLLPISLHQHNRLTIISQLTSEQ